MVINLMDILKFMCKHLSLQPNLDYRFNETLLENVWKFFY